MENISELKSTLSELQVCTDASLVCASTTESLNVKAAKMGILSSDYIGEEKHDMPNEKVEGIAEIGKNRVRVPVVAADGTPLMPCTAAKAKRLLKEGKARYGWNKLGLFFIRLNYGIEKEKVANQNLVLGIDPGSKFEGYSVSGKEDNLANLMVEAKTWVKKAVQTRREMRRARRFRNTRRRKNKHNRLKGKHIAPSTRARAEARIEIARQLGKTIPFKTIIIEDVKAATKKTRSKKTKKWNMNFSPIEVGKEYMYSGLRNLSFEVKLISGFETKAIRDKIRIKKSTDKSKRAFESHCIDAWAIASTSSNAKYPTDRNITYLVPIQLRRRQLHRLQPKEGKRIRYGGTMSNGIKKGTLVKSPKYGLCYVGGNWGKGVSLHSYQTGKRIAVRQKVEKIRRTVSYQKLDLLHSSLKAGVAEGA